MKTLTDRLKTFGGAIEKIVWTLGSRAFLFILVLILIDLAIGGFIFYKYVFLAEKQNFVPAKNVIKFDAKTYQEVLDGLKDRIGQPPEN